MATNPEEKKQQDQQHKNAAVKPDEETLHKTDPQDNMKGPVSSLMQTVKETAEDNDKESKEEADIKKDEKM
jgi:hypothetical protein